MGALRWVGLATISLLLLGGCAGKPKQVGDPKTPDGTEPKGDVEQTELGGTVKDPDVPGLNGANFDQEAADVLLKRGGRKAAECTKVVPGMPTGEFSVDVVFDGKKGKIVDVQLGAGLGGASDLGQQCVKNSFIGEFIQPFDGTKTVSYSLTLK